MKSDHKWLEQWRPLLENKVVLELGCGSGIDTAFIVDVAEHSVACDIRLPQISKGHLQNLVMDHSKSLPFSDNSFDVVVASLSLHYFYSQNTTEVLDEILRILTPEGLLICRVNSRDDTHYGANGYPELEDGLYNVNGSPKRFFNKNDINNFFDEKWQVHGLRHQTIDRYDKPKKIWEFIAKKSSSYNHTLN